MIRLVVFTSEFEHQQDFDPIQWIFHIIIPSFYFYNTRFFCKFSQLCDFLFFKQGACNYDNTKKWRAKNLYSVFFVLVQSLIPNVEFSMNWGVKLCFTELLRRLFEGSEGEWKIKHYPTITVGSQQKPAGTPCHKRETQRICKHTPKKKKKTQINTSGLNM